MLVLLASFGGRPSPSARAALTIAPAADNFGDVAVGACRVGSHLDMNSEWQLATKATGMNLVGKTAYPSPDTDPVNGVTGTVTISWSLKPN